jgi:toxin secretion/phage lysis holin
MEDDMMNNALVIKNSVLTGLSLFGTLFANALGGWDAALALLIGMMAADYITGILIAALWQKSNKSESGALSSKAGFKGLCKKAVILLAVWIGTLLDTATGATYIRTAIVLFYIGNEGLSLIENFGLMGVPYPPAMKKALEAMRDKVDKEQ